MVHSLDLQDFYLQPWLGTLPRIDKSQLKNKLFYAKENSVFERNEQKFKLQPKRISLKKGKY